MNSDILDNTFQAVLFTNRATCYLKLNNYELCLRDSIYAIELDKNYAKPYLRTAEVYEIMENYEKALKYLNIYLEKE